MGCIGDPDPLGNIVNLFHCIQCVGSGWIRNYLLDPDPQFKFWIRKGSGIKFRQKTDFLLDDNVNSSRKYEISESVNIYKLKKISENSSAISFLSTST